MAKKRRELPELTPAQGEIMDIVWGVGEVSASEVQAHPLQTRKVARNTVRTLLERMEEKGLDHPSRGGTDLSVLGGAASAGDDRAEGPGDRRDGVRRIAGSPGDRPARLPRTEFRRT